MKQVFERKVFYSPAGKSILGKTRWGLEYGQSPTVKERKSFQLLFQFHVGCKLQVSIQRQDEKGQYHVLLMADSGHSQVAN